MQILNSKQTFNNQKMQMCIKNEPFYTSQKQTRTNHLFCYAKPVINSFWKHTLYISFMCLSCAILSCISLSDIKCTCVHNWNRNRIIGTGTRCQISVTDTFVESTSSKSRRIQCNLIYDRVVFARRVVRHTIYLYALNLTSNARYSIFKFGY